MKNDLTTGAWHHDIGCPISITLLSTSDASSPVAVAGAVHCYLSCWRDALSCDVLALINAAICMERFAKWELMVPVMVLAVLLLEMYALLVAVKLVKRFCEAYPP